MLASKLICNITSDQSQTETHSHLNIKRKLREVEYSHKMHLRTDNGNSCQKIENRILIPKVLLGL